MSKQSLHRRDRVITFCVFECTGPVLQRTPAHITIFYNQVPFASWKPVSVPSGAKGALKAALGPLGFNTSNLGTQPSVRSNYRQANVMYARIL